MCMLTIKLYKLHIVPATSVWKTHMYSPVSTVGRAKTFMSANQSKALT